MPSYIRCRKGSYKHQVKNHLWEINAWASKWINRIIAYNCTVDGLKEKVQMIPRCSLRLNMGNLNFLTNGTTGIATKLPTVLT